jgi:hypothetical protein
MPSSTRVSWPCLSRKLFSSPLMEIEAMMGVLSVVVGWEVRPCASG